MRKFRKKGIGQFAMRTILKTYKGRWQVRVWENNKVAHAFWDNIINKFSNHSATLTKIKYQGHDGLLVYRFTS